MKQVLSFLIFLVSFQLSYAQNKAVDNYVEIDKKALQLTVNQTLTTDILSAFIKMNFKTDKEKARAIFIWIATNINYDIENMYSIDYNDNDSINISRTIQTRKGVCANYAALFKELCSKMGIRSYIIDGYTKQNGIVDNASHAWCAALIDGAWYLFDPTWGSGYVSKGKYYKKINNSYFMAKPSGLISSHMPYDYLWQFLDYPTTNQEFIEGKTGTNESKKQFNFKDSIDAYDKQDTYSRLASSASRIEKNGIKNALIVNKLQNVKQNIENIKHNSLADLYNSAVLDCNEGVKSLNAFIDYRNKQFVPKKSDQLIQTMLDDTNEKLKMSKSKIIQLKSTDSNLTLLIGQLNKTIDDITSQLVQQQSWLKVYFSKGKLGRKMMFVGKVTWFGIPLV